MKLADTTANVLVYISAELVFLRLYALSFAKFYGRFAVLGTQVPHGSEDGSNNSMVVKW